MPQNRSTPKPPAIHVYLSENAGPKAEYIDMLYGIEEEGVPFELVTSTLQDVKELSYEAAVSSNLSVGVGINADEVALHFDKLPCDMPLFHIDREIDKGNMRNIGINAARLVKRMPFNTINQRRRRESDVQ